MNIAISQNEQLKSQKCINCFQCISGCSKQGALKYHQGFPDVHFHLARTLDELGRRDEAETHWREFLDLAPDSPWADEAVSRLRCT